MVTSRAGPEALETSHVVTNLALAYGRQRGLTLISAILGAGGALAAGLAIGLRRRHSQDPRRYPRAAARRLCAGISDDRVATAIFGVIAGSVAAWLS